MAWMREKIQIDKNYKPAQRELIAKEILDFIVERTTKKNLDKDNVKLAPYSDSYKKSKAFKQAGKSSGKVNLTFTGDMLEDLKVLSHKSGEITIGYTKGSTSNGKAEGNIEGTYGQKKQVAPKRDFLGIHEKDLDKILGTHPTEKTLSASDIAIINRIKRKLGPDATASDIVKLVRFQGLKEIADKIEEEGI